LVKQVIYLISIGNMDRYKKRSSTEGAGDAAASPSNIFGGQN